MEEATRQSKFNTALNWAAAIALSISIAFALEKIGIPGARLIGPMAAGIIVALKGRIVTVPMRAFQAAQVVVALMIAKTVSPAVLASFAADYPVYLSVAAATLIASNAIGWWLSKSRLLPGTTGIWGSAPGAAAAMVIMAQGFGADIRLVATMQYLRIVLVGFSAAIIAHGFAASESAAASAPPASDLMQVLLTLGLGTIAGYVGSVSRMPSGVFLLPIFSGVFLNASGLAPIALPDWLVTLAIGLSGLWVGGQFSRDSFRYAITLLPNMLLAIAILMLFCFLMGLALVEWRGVDLLSAYLATSPGGLDAAAIIAASAHADVSFVVGLQTVRFLTVIALGPFIARFIAARL